MTSGFPWQCDILPAGGDVKGDISISRAWAASCSSEVSSNSSHASMRCVNLQLLKPVLETPPLRWCNSVELAQRCNANQTRIRRSIPSSSTARWRIPQSTHNSQDGHLRLGAAALSQPGTCWWTAQRNANGAVC